MPDWLIILLGLSATTAPIVTGYFVARRYQRIGGGEAQIKLNVTLKELNEAYEDRIDTLEEDFKACKIRLEHMEKREANWLEERIEMKRELAAVYARLGMTKRMDDPNV